jgi:hypothetical protein
MTTTRQHDDTEVIEWYGHPCEQLLLLVDESGDPLIFFAMIANSWHRFYLDAGILFWREIVALSLEDELEQGDKVVDLGKDLAWSGRNFEEIRMKDNQLTIRVSGGGKLVVVSTPRSESARITEAKAAS